MASSNKRKTTMAKMQRERGLAEKRLEKAARKAARQQAATHNEVGPNDHLTDEAGEPLSGQAAVDAAMRARAEIEGL